jgi:phosphoglycolate phosphatase-like HAD superfamily hydrolase
MRVLLLFDIDGTLLIRAADAHRDALSRAIREVHGVDMGDDFVATAGRTDPAICRSMLMLAGVEAKAIDDGAQAVQDAAIAAYAELCPEDLSDHVPAGAVECLDRLASEDHVLSLVTGNLEPIARLKLRRAGLGGRFSRGQGAFGSDHEDRAALPAVARARAGGRERPHPRADTVVIGDTPLDVQCARADGVRCIAVATGPHPAAELRDADAVIASLSELPEALAGL